LVWWIQDFLRGKDGDKYFGAGESMEHDPKNVPLKTNLKLTP